MKLLLPTVLVTALCLWKFVVAKNIYIDHFYPVVYILTFMWGRNMMLMQVCYVTKQRFHSLNLGNSFIYVRYINFYWNMDCFKCTLLNWIFSWVYS